MISVDNPKKTFKIKSLLLGVGGIFLLLSCGNDSEKSASVEKDVKHPETQIDSVDYIKLSGNTQGTTYEITYQASTGKVYKREIDSILLDFDNSLSTYNPGSLLSEFNENGEVKPDAYFLEVLKQSRHLNQITQSYFNPAIYNLIELWGIDYEDESLVSQEDIDSIMPLCDLNAVYYDTATSMLKRKAKVKLEFNAIAQGYSVDVIAAFLQSEGITNYMVEIGGEMVSKGNFHHGSEWTAAIEKPQKEKTKDVKDAALELKLINKGLATSGSYRKFKEVNGERYSHILDPFTGYPAKNSLLSATVISKDASSADAYATAFMSMGLEKTLKFLETELGRELDVFLIYFENGSNKTFMTEGFENLVVKSNPV